MRVLRSLLVTSLLVGAAACGGDDSSTTDTTTPTTGSATTTETTTTETTTTTTTTATPTTTAATTTTTTTTATPTTTPTTETTTTTTPTATTTTAATTTTVTTTTLPNLVDVRIYFLRGEQLAIEHRDVEGPAVLRGAISALLEGSAGDLLTAIPAGTQLLDVALRDGTATIDLNSAFESGGGSLSMLARVAQVVFTATQYDNVDEVVFWLDGAPVEYLGGEGIVMSEPWTRSDVPRELTGGVIVDTPRPGDAVTSPFVVTGEADVYEAQFPIEIRRDGTTIAVIAPVWGGAWGDWADFTTTVAIDAEPGPIELVAFDEGGCGDDPGCPPVIETIVPLILQ